MKSDIINAMNVKKEYVYDNKGAHDTIKYLMENKAILRIKFIADRDGYVAAMIETAKIGGFKYRLNEKNFEWLWKYITEGAVEDFGIDPMEVQPDEEAEEFQETLLRQIVLGKENVATCAGCTVALETLATLLAEPGDAFLIPAPYYSSFVDDINERAGVIAVGVPCDETLSRDAFEEAYEK